LLCTLTLQDSRKLSLEHDLAQDSNSLHRSECNSCMQIVARRFRESLDAVELILKRDRLRTIPDTRRSAVFLLKSFRSEHIPMEFRLLGTFNFFNVAHALVGVLFLPTIVRLHLTLLTVVFLIAASHIIDPLRFGRGEKRFGSLIFLLADIRCCLGEGGSGGRICFKSCSMASL